MGQGDDFKTGHPYFKENYRLITIDLSKQQTPYDKEPKEEIKCDFLSAIVIGSVFKSSKKYYSQKNECKRMNLPEECKYKIKEKELNHSLLMI